MANISRRHLLLGAGSAGFATSLGALTGLSGSRAWAADTSGYKALVCLFFFGGMDQSDTVIPYDQSEYDILSTQARQGLFGAHNSGSATSTRNRSNLLALSPGGVDVTGGRQFALPPELTSLHDMFNAGDLAIVGNVGPLIEPTTRAAMDANTAILPKRLYSHNDQQSTWMALSTEGARFGWGGQFVDRAMASAPGQNTAFASISTGSNGVFLSGQDTAPMRVSNQGAALPALLDKEYYLGHSNADDAARAAIRDYVLSESLGDRNVYAKDLRGSIASAQRNAETLITANQQSTPFATPFGSDSLSRQFQAVAQTIQIQQALNISRQVFFVSTGGFDTHSGQAGQIVGLHSRIANALASFKSAMQEIGRWNDVVVFTASDFGRTQIDNGDGTDHGWGGHHFVAGGGVRGGQLYGSFPVADPSSNDYTERRGRMIPTVSVEQYAATLGRWFGLDAGEINTVLPNLSNFNTSDLGFMSVPTI